MLSYPSAISLSTRSLNHLTTLLRGHRHTLRSRWRRLEPGRQALLVLAHLRNGDTYARLAAGFGIGVATAWRYIREAVDLLAATAPDLTEAMGRIRRLAFVILDGTLIAIDRIRGHKDRPHYSGKHKRHGVNVQVIADPHGRLVWLSPALPGATHDLTAARAHGIIAALTSAAVATLADKAYRGAGGAIGVPHYGRDLPTRMRDCNSSHNQIRGIGERANATLKTWKILIKLRCCPRRATTIVRAILVLHHVEANRYAA
jgi:DDE superfamily endonuclease